MYGTVADGEPEEVELESPTLKKRPSTSNALKQVARYLRRYKHLRQRLQNTTFHGLTHVVKANSCVFRLFWTVIFLAALGGCLYSILDRIIYFTKRPSTTTISLGSGKHNISFPAVTLCNLNSVKLSYAKENNLSSLLGYASNPFVYNNTMCEQLIYTSDAPLDRPLRQVYYESRSTLDEFVRYCAFFGNNLSLLNCAESLSLTLTDLGYCYTFNGEVNAPEVTVGGVGATYGLHVLLEINQSEYLPNFGDAGVKVAIHPRGVPPQPYSKGISIPAGRSGSIALQNHDIRDTSTNSDCVQNRKVKHFGSSHYSTSACQLSDMYSDVALGCDCLDALNDNVTWEGSMIPNCTVADICCVTSQHIIGNYALCPAACSYTSYKASTTYSTFPSSNSVAFLSLIFNHTILNITENLVLVKVYYEDLNTQTITTEDSYSFVALLSDMGGHLGLFLGASVISVIELCIYCIDVDNCSECSHKKRKHTSLKEEEEEDSTGSEREGEHERYLVDGGDATESAPLMNSTKI